MRITPTDGALENFTDDEVLWLRNIAKESTTIYFDGIKQVVSHIDNQNLNNDETVALWSLLISKIRSAYKEQKDFERAECDKSPVVF